MYTSTEEAARRHPDVTVLVNFSSFRYDVTYIRLCHNALLSTYMHNGSLHGMSTVPDVTVLVNFSSFR